MAESRTPYTTSNLWDTIRNRLEMAAQKAGGACGITISILAVNGLPVSWTAPDVTTMEPRRCADELLLFLTQGSATVVRVNDEGEPIQGE